MCVLEPLVETWVGGELIPGEAIAGIIDAVFVAPHAGEHARPGGGAVGDRMGDDAIREAAVRDEGIEVGCVRDRQRTGHGAVDADNEHFLVEAWGGGGEQSVGLAQVLPAALLARARK